MNRDLFKTKDAMEYLQVSKRKMQRLRDSGQIRFYQDQHTIWYRKQDLDSFIDSLVMPAFAKEKEDIMKSSSFK